MKLQILKYEIKKIFCKRSSIISLILLGVVLGVSLFLRVAEVEYTTPSGDRISGIKAVKLLKNEKMKWNGVLTEEFLAKVIKENHDINSDSRYANMKESDVKLSNIQYSHKQGFSDIRSLIIDSFSEFHSYDARLIDSLNTQEASKFYSNRVNTLKTFLNSDEADFHLTKSEKEYLINSAETIHTPFKYSYADGWSYALEFSAMVTFFLAFVTCILMAPIFSIEYQTGCDAILLSTEHGKKKEIIYKLIAGLISISLVYWITVCVVFSFIFMIFGFEGGDCPIQMFAWKSFYHVTNSEALWMTLLLGYVACLFIGTLAMFLSAKVKTSFATVILLVLLIMVPSTVDQFIIEGSLWDKIINMLPCQALQGWRLLYTFTLYDFAGKVITPYQILPVLYGIFTILLLPFAYNAFRRHQIA